MSKRAWYLSLVGFTSAAVTEDVESLVNLPEPVTSLTPHLRDIGSSFAPSGFTDWRSYRQSSKDETISSTVRDLILSEHVMIQLAHSAPYRLKEHLPAVQEAINNGLQPSGAELEPINNKIQSQHTLRFRHRAQAYLDAILAMNAKPFPTARKFHDAQLSEIASKLRNVLSASYPLDSSPFLSILTSFRLTLTPRFSSQEKTLALLLEKRISGSTLPPSIWAYMSAPKLDLALNRPFLGWLNLREEVQLEARFTASSRTEAQTLFNVVLWRLGNLIDSVIRHNGQIEFDSESFRVQIRKINEHFDASNLFILLDRFELNLKNSEDAKSKFWTNLRLLTNFTLMQRIMCIIKLQYAMKLKIEFDALAQAVNKNPPNIESELTLPSSAKLAESLELKKKTPLPVPPPPVASTLPKQTELTSEDKEGAKDEDKGDTLTIEASEDKEGANKGETQHTLIVEASEDEEGATEGETEDTLTAETSEATEGDRREETIGAVLTEGDQQQPGEGGRADSQVEIEKKETPELAIDNKVVETHCSRGEDKKECSRNSAVKDVKKTGGSEKGLSPWSIAAIFGGGTAVLTGIGFFFYLRMKPTETQ